MLARELREYCDKDDFIRKYFKNVISSNDNVYHKTNSAYIVNTSDSDSVGSHWVVMFLKGDEMSIFYDSLAEKPNCKIESNYNGVYARNVKQCQSSTSTVCGQHCLFVLYHLCRGVKYNVILDMYSNNMQHNDCLVNAFYNLTK